MLDIKVRPAEPDDCTAIYNLLKHIATIHRRARPDMFPNLVSKYSHFQIYERLCEFEHGVFVAEFRQRFLGYIFCDIIKEGDGLTLYIDDLCVDPNVRRYGVGTELLNYAAQYGKEKNCRYLMLNVWEFNDEAIRFYEKYGFETRTRHMEKKLTD